MLKFITKKLNIDEYINLIKKIKNINIFLNLYLLLS